MQISFSIFHLIFLFFQVSSSVIGIDYGTDWLKVSILKPGGAIETVLNRESKRKTDAVINIRNGVRSYGIEAVTLVRIQFFLSAISLASFYIQGHVSMS